MDAGVGDAGKGGGGGNDGGRALPGNAELVFGLAGGDLFMGFCIDVRIDADGDFGDEAARSGELREKLKLGLGFDIELVDAGFKREEIGRASCRERVCQYV